LTELATARILMANAVLERMFGVSAGGLVGADYLDLVSLEGRTESSAVRTALQAGQIKNFQSRRLFRRSDGDNFWVDLNGSVFKDAESGPAMGIVIMKDVTEQQPHEVEIEAAHERLKKKAESYARLAADLEVAKRAAEEARVLAESANR